MAHAFLSQQQLLNQQEQCQLVGYCENEIYQWNAPADFAGLWQAHL